MTIENFEAPKLARPKFLKILTWGLKANPVFSREYVYLWKVSVKRASILCYMKNKFMAI
jgi:hypothetical protein